ncbi:MAG: DUF721 domain-containing protein [Elusimicrobiota bacterium]|jgi:hypothetical protein|nr:DUF721 domain-containing protein [Elusimicrobiota bacterium]
MKFGKKPQAIWHESKELTNGFSKFNLQINRLMLLDNLWEKVVGSKAKYWKLYAVKGGTLYVKTAATAAKHELLLTEKQIIRELNKSFDKPWIKSISAV